MAQPCFVGGILLILFMVTQSASERFHVIGPSTAVTAIVGEEIVFSCHINPQMDAQNMEVGWYNLHSSVLVHHYKTFQDQTEHQSPEYQGRTEFLRENITKGQVALKIHHIHPSDEGDYSCFFQSSSYYSEAQFKLLVSGTGTGPHIHIEHGKTGEIKLTCTSTGWYPEPEVLWKDVQGQHLASVSEKKTAENNGLFHVETSVTVDESLKRTVSCFIRNPLLSVVKEGYISLSGDLFPSINPWIVGLAVFLGLLSISLVITWILFNRVRKSKDQVNKKYEKVNKDYEKVNKDYEKVNKDYEQVYQDYCQNLVELDYAQQELERRKLIGKEGLNRVRKCAEDITLDKDTAHPYLQVSDDEKTVRSLQNKQDLPENEERFERLEAVLGRNAFSSGDHYWEVKVEGKNRWTIGLCLAKTNRKGHYISACPENGFWTLCLKNGVYIALSTPRYIICIPEPISIVGIFLQYEKGLISFYNVTEFTILYTFKIKTTEILRPYFYPGPLNNKNYEGLELLKVLATEQ